MHPDAADTSRSLRALIEAEPGITKSELRRSTGLAWGTVCHHTDRLVAAGLVQVHEGGKHKHLFRADVPGDALQRQVVLRRPHTREVLRLFEARREVDIPHAMEATGLSRRIVTLRLAELEEAGLLERRGTGRPRFARIRLDLGLWSPRRLEQAAMPLAVA